MEHEEEIPDGPNDSGGEKTRLSPESGATLPPAAVNVPAGVYLQMYALAMMLSRRSLNSKNVSAFSRRLALKMDLNPNWKYSRSKGRRESMSSCGGQTDV